MSPYVRRLIDNLRSLREWRLSEGSWSNEGLWWINPEGRTFLVNPPDGSSNLSHEEWANKHMNVSLEKLLKTRWVRVQAMPNQYLFIDHRQQRLSATQARVLANFFFDEGQRIKNYPRGIVVERYRNDMREFTNQQGMTAYEFAVSGEIFEPNPDDMAELEKYRTTQADLEKTRAAV